MRDDSHSYHEYTTAFFINFLVAHQGVPFVNLWQEVAALNTNARSALDTALRTLTGRGLGAHYQDFARCWAFDATSPVRTILKKTVLDVEEPRLSQRVEDATKSLSLSVALEGEHSAKVVGLAAPAAGARRGLRISAPSLPTDTLIDVYASSASESFVLVVAWRCRPRRSMRRLVREPTSTCSSSTMGRRRQRSALPSNSQLPR